MNAVSNLYQLFASLVHIFYRNKEKTIYRHTVVEIEYLKPELSLVELAEFMRINFDSISKEKVIGSIIKL